MRLSLWPTLYALWWPCAKLIVRQFKNQNFYFLPVNVPQIRVLPRMPTTHVRAERHQSLFRSESVRHFRMSTCTQYGVLGAGIDNILIISSRTPKNRHTTREKRHAHHTKFKLSIQYGWRDLQISCTCSRPQHNYHGGVRVSMIV